MELNITLERDDALNLIAVLINYHSLIEALYNECEPTGSLVTELNNNITKQLLEGGLRLTYGELQKRTDDIADAVKGLRL